MKNNLTKYILLSFDLEEFDIPLEYGQSIEMKEQFEVGLKGLNTLLPILEKNKVQATFFTTANFAKQFPNVLQQLSNTHEIASHAYTHTGFNKEDYLKSKTILEEITGKKVYGFRMPRLQKTDTHLLLESGYLYDSSYQPTYIPSRYNNRHLPNYVYTDNGLLKVPCSVSADILKFPLFWLSFKNFPLFFYNYFVTKTLNKNKFACLYFHPWEYAEISKYKLPNYIKKPCGLNLANKLDTFIANNLQKGNQFITLHNFLLQHSVILK